MQRIALLALFLTLVAAGCGEGSNQTTTHGVTRADYIDRADATCRNHQSRREDLESQASDLGRLNSEAKAHDVADLLREESANRTAEVNELRSLQPPPPDTAVVSSILSQVRAETDVLEEWAAAYDDLDAERIRKLQIRLGVTAARAADRARAYGFAVCGQQ